MPPRSTSAVVGVRRDALEMLRHHQAGDGAEVLLLVEVEQRVAVVRGLDDRASAPRRASAAAAAHSSSTAPPGAAGADRETHDASHVHGTYCQTLTSNSGCSLPVESLICSSMYFGSVPLSIFSVAPRL